MAFAYVGGTNAIFPDVHASVAVSPGIGNLMVVTGCEAQANSTISISDTAGHTWAVANPATNAIYTFKCWYAVASASSTTITINGDGAAVVALIYDEFSGGSTPALDQHLEGTYTSNGLGATSGSVTLTSNNEMLYAGRYNSGATTGPGTGYLLCQNITSRAWVTEYEVLTGGSGSSQSANFAEPSGNNGLIFLATFAPGSGGGGGSPSVKQRLTLLGCGS